MTYVQDTSSAPTMTNAPAAYSEWFVSRRAALNMIELFSHLLTEREKHFYATGRHMQVIRAIEVLAKDARKCRELNSIETLCVPINTVDGPNKVTYYNVGDVVFVTTPGRFPNQKYINRIASLSAQLRDVELARQANENAGRSLKPLRVIRKMRSTAGGRNYFRGGN